MMLSFSESDNNYA